MADGSPYVDADAARQAGYTDDQIVDEVGKRFGWNVGAARDAGYSTPEIMAQLSTRVRGLYPDTSDENRRLAGTNATMTQPRGLIRSQMAQAPAQPAPEAPSLSEYGASVSPEGELSAAGSGIGSGALKGLGAASNQVFGVTPALAASVVPIAVDAARNALGSAKNTTEAQDWWFRNIVDPLVKNQQALEPGAGFDEKLGHSLGGAIGVLSQAVLTGGESLAPKVANELQPMGQYVAERVTHGIKSIAAPAISDMVDTMRGVYDQTGDMGQAIKAGLARWQATSAAGAVPMGSEGPLLGRMAGSSISGTASGELTREGMNTVLPPSMQQPFSGEGMALNAASGAVLGVGGHDPHAIEAHRAAKMMGDLDALDKAQTVDDMIAATAAATTGRDPVMDQVLSAADRMRALRSTMPGQEPGQPTAQPAGRGIIGSLLALPSPPMNPALMIGDAEGNVRPATQREFESNNVQVMPRGPAGLLPAPERSNAPGLPYNPALDSTRPTGRFRVTPEGEAVPEIRADIPPAPEPQPDTGTRVGNLPDRTVEVPARAPQEAATPVDLGAHESATSPHNDLDEPSPDQIAAGNYQKGHAQISGEQISIENPEGSVRRSKPGFEPAWQTTMRDAHYGYLRGTEDGTGEHIDTFIKPGTPPDHTGPVYVVDQIDAKTGEHDEAKALIGYGSKEEAARAYHSNYEPGWAGMGAITEMPWNQFRAWAHSDAAKQPVDPEAVAERAAIMHEAQAHADALDPELWKSDVVAAANPHENANALKALGLNDEEVATFQDEAGSRVAPHPADVAGTASGGRAPAGREARNQAHGPDKALTEPPAEPLQSRAVPRRADLAWKDVELGRRGDVYVGRRYTLDPVRELDPNSDDLYLGNNVPDGNRVIRYGIKDNETGRQVGHTDLEHDSAGNIVGLHDIHVDEPERRNGIGREVIGSLAANSGPLEIRQIVPSAEGFWNKVGASTKDPYGNATLDWHSFATHQGRAGEALESRVGRGAALDQRGGGEARQEARPQDRGPSAEEGVATGRPRAGLSTSEVRQEAVNHFGEDTVRRLERAGLFNIEQSHPDSAVRAEYDPSTGRATFYGDNLRHGEVVPTVYHEIGEHHGLRDYLGHAGYKQLQRDLGTMRRAGNRVVSGTWDRVKDAHSSFRGRDDADLANDDRFTHELVARLGQKTAARAQSWWGRLVEGIRRFLRERFGIGTLDQNAIGNLLAGSLRKVAREAGAQPQRTLNGDQARPQYESPWPSKRLTSDELAKLPKAPASFRDAVGRVVESDSIGRVKDLTNRVLDPLKMALDPMEKGSDRAQAIVKDAANAIRYARYQWSRIDDILRREFTPEERERMWDAADEENEIRAGRAPDLDGMGLKSLTKRQRDVMDTLHAYGEELFQRAKDAGMVDAGAEGVPYWAPRMAALISEDGEVARIPGRPESASGSGANVVTSSPNLKRRRPTLAETEEAGRAAFGDKFEVVRDIRTMPLAMERLERAVAGRELIDKIKEIGEQTGTDTVGTWRDSRDFFTLDHPAFKTYRYVTDDAGRGVVKSVPLWVSKEFEGPLKALLSEKQGDIYKGLMAIKGAATQLIMFSPMIHNLVVFGKALPAMPGKVATFRVYFDGNRAKNDPETMRRAILAGMAPIGKMGGYQDITGIARGLGDEPGAVANAVGRLVGAIGGDSAKTAGAVHKAGDFWHNTLLWDRVGDLQAGLFVNIERDLLRKGMDATSAAREAAHFANLYAGSLPNEAMSNAARKTANLMLFSRSFTLSNLGAMQAMVRGLPPDLQAQIKRDSGVLGLRLAQGSTRRKAIGMVMADIALLWGAQALLRAGIQSMQGQNLDDIAQGYVDRFHRLLGLVKESPLATLAPLSWVDNLNKLGPGGDNEPGKENRLLYGYDEQGTAQYLRLPFGKTAEEMSGWMNDPLTVLRNKESTILRPAIQTLTNDLGYGHRLWHEDDNILQRAGKIAWNLLSQQVPLDSLKSAAKLVSGEGDGVDATKVVGSLTGFSTSHGARGGPEVGLEREVEQKKRARIGDVLPDAMDKFRQAARLEQSDPQRSSDLYDEGEKALTDAGMPRVQIGAHIRLARDPRAARLTPQAMRKFYQEATEEEQARMDAYQRDTEAAGVQ